MRAFWTLSIWLIGVELGYFTFVAVTTESMFHAIFAGFLFGLIVTLAVLLGRSE